MLIETRDGIVDVADEKLRLIPFLNDLQHLVTSNTVHGEGRMSVGNVDTRTLHVLLAIACGHEDAAEPPSLTDIIMFLRAADYLQMDEVIQRLYKMMAEVIMDAGDAELGLLLA